MIAVSRDLFVWSGADDMAVPKEAREIPGFLGLWGPVFKLPGLKTWRLFSRAAILFESRCETRFHHKQKNLDAHE